MPFVKNYPVQATKTLMNSLTLGSCMELRRLISLLNRSAISWKTWMQIKVCIVQLTLCV